MKRTRPDGGGRPRVLATLPSARPTSRARPLRLLPARTAAGVARRLDRSRRIDGARPVSVARSDAGFSLVELVVSLSIFSVFGAVVTAGLLHAFRLSNRSEQQAQAQAQATVAFLRLENRIRYATGVSLPGQSTNGDWWVEYETNNSGADRCGELRVSSASLLWREWTHGTTPAGWTTLATGVTGSTPFAYVPAGSAAYPALTVTVTSSVAGISRQISTSFPVLNAVPDTDTSTVCTEGRATP